eukprot:TRINITY_DN23552_c0_g1_i1.p1 TRINITY_DN23552_c0_g1~~TRINITY_DN23552_c0_g1_i1.p1  ORF type:complete len:1208 (+),score=417.60 TRINITY_DN23552_c0_g1_i1:267-3890(+)
MNRNLKKSLKKGVREATEAVLNRFRLRMIVCLSYIAGLVLGGVYLSYDIVTSSSEESIGSIDATRPLFVNFKNGTHVAFNMQQTPAGTNPPVSMIVNKRNLACEVFYDRTNNVLDISTTEIITLSFEQKFCNVTMSIAEGTMLPDTFMDATSVENVFIRTVNQDPLIVTHPEFNWGSGSLFINGTFVHTDIRNAQIGSLTVLSTSGLVEFHDTTVVSGATLSAAKGSIEFDSRSSFIASYITPRNLICMSGAVLPTETCNLQQNECAGLNATVVDCDPNKLICVDGVVPLYATVADAAAGSAGLVTVKMTSLDGNLLAYAKPVDVDKSALQSFRGSDKPEIDFSPETQILLKEKFSKDNLEFTDMYIMRVVAPELPEDIIYLWSKQEIYYRVPTPILGTMSAFILLPVMEELILKMSPTFCASDALTVEDKLRKMYLLFKKRAVLPEGFQRTTFGYQDGCRGSRVFGEDQATETVTLNHLTIFNDSTTMTALFLSIALASIIGIVGALVLSKVVQKQMHKKREDLLRRFRRLKKQGFADIGKGNVMFYAPKDTSTWKQGFYISNPFGKVFAARSVERDGTFIDVFRALNAQPYQKIPVELEEEALVRRARQAKLELEKSSATTLVRWYKRTLLRIGMDITAKRISKEMAVVDKKKQKKKMMRKMVYGNEEDRADPDQLADMEAEERKRRAQAAHAAMLANRKARLAKKKAANQGKKLTPKQKQEQSEEVFYIKYFVGPLLLLEIFIETLSATVLPSPETSGPVVDDDLKKITKIKQLAKAPSLNNAIAAVQLALSIKGKELKANALTVVKQSSRQYATEVNRLISMAEKKKGMMLAGLNPEAAWKMQQFIMVTAHMAFLTLPAAVPVMGSVLLFFNWKSHPLYSHCPLNILIFSPIWLGAISWYGIAILCLLTYYKGGYTRFRIHMRNIFFIALYIMLGISLALLSMMAMWIGLGLLLKPAVAFPYATGLGGLGAFAKSVYGKLKAFKEEIELEAEKFLKEQSERLGVDLDTLKEDVLSRVLDILNLSPRNIIVLLVTNLVTLSVVFSFLFLGMAVFSTGSTEDGAISTFLTGGTGGLAVMGNGKKEPSEKGKKDFQAKIRGYLTQALKGAMPKTDNDVQIEAPDGEGKELQSTEVEVDLDLVTNTGDSVKQMRKDGAIKQARELDILVASPSRQNAQEGFDLMWSSSEDDEETPLVGGGAGSSSQV